MSDNSRENTASVRLVASFLMLYAALLGTACYLRFESFQYTDFDLAVHSQSLNNMLRGSLDCSILGIPYFGNHMAVILYLVAPLYAVFPSPVTLLLLQSLVLAAGSIAVFIYAKQRLSFPLPAVLAACYLMYPPLIYMNLYEFHPVALASTFLLFALLTYQKKHFRWYMAFLVLAMACQENISLIVIMLGLKSLVDRRPAKWSAVPVISGVLWFAACILWIMPRMNPGIVPFHRIYSQFGGSLTEIAVNILRDPLGALRFAAAPSKLLYLASLLLPLALTPLAAPLELLPALPALAQRLLSVRESETTILFHYQAELIPFIFTAAVHGLERLGRFNRKSIQKAAAVCIAALTVLSVKLSALPAAIHRITPAAEETRELNVLRRQLLRTVDTESSVVSTFRYLSHLSDRRSIESLHHIYTGYYTLSDVPYPLPADIDFIIIDRDDPLTFGAGGFFTAGGHTNIQNLLTANRMLPVTDNEPLVFFVRDPVLKDQGGMDPRSDEATEAKP